MEPIQPAMVGMVGMVGMEEPFFECVTMSSKSRVMQSQLCSLQTVFEGSASCIANHPSFAGVCARVIVLQQLAIDFK
jgi:hypothetical protein